MCKLEPFFRYRKSDLTSYLQELMPFFVQSIRSRVESGFTRSPIKGVGCNMLLPTGTVYAAPREILTMTYTLTPRGLSPLRFSGTRLARDESGLLRSSCVLSSGRSVRTEHVNASDHEPMRFKDRAAPHIWKLYWSPVVPSLHATTYASLVPHCRVLHYIVRSNP